MQFIINAPKSINSTVKLPASKSISNRAMIIYALSGGKTMPENLSDCDDTEVIVNAIQNMPDVIDIKAAGTAMRFLSAYLSVKEGTHTITGTERMKHRPIGVLVDALRFLGADITYLDKEGFPPLKITGKKHNGGYLEIPGSVSSQYISALLMIGPILCKGLTLKLTGEIISRPYIDLTLWMMTEFGAEADWSDIDTITVKPKPYKSREYSIESDWSAASYWYEALALSGNDEDEIKFTGLMDGSKQGDSIARYLFSLMGVKTIFDSTQQFSPTTVTLRKVDRHVSRLDYDFINSPDLAQTFVVSCALMDIPFKFTGLRTLKIKETDRIEALKAEMKKLGFIIKDENGSSLIWDGEKCEPAKDIAIDTYEDHRMALSFAPAAIRIPGIKINDPQVVTKSYPNFWNDMKKVGFEIDEG